MRDRVTAYERGVPAAATTGTALRRRVGWSRLVAGACDAVKRERLHRHLLWLVTLGTAGSGLLNIYSVIGQSLPARTRFLEKIFPLEFQHFSRFLTLLIGFALVVSSINIYRRKRRALWFCVFLSIFSVTFHLTKGIDYEEAFVSLL